MVTLTNPTSGGAKRLRRLALPLALAAVGFFAAAADSQAEVCELLQLTKVELNPVAGGPSDFAKLTGPNTFTITVKKSWPWSPALMNYARFTYGLKAGTDLAWLPQITAAGGATFLANQYASPFEGWNATKVSTRTDGWPTPHPQTKGWPSYPAQVYFKTGPVNLGSCTEIRSEVATLTLDPRELYRLNDVPVAGCLDCPQVPIVKLPDIKGNPVLIEPVKGKVLVQR